MKQPKAGDLIRRYTDGAVGVVVEAPLNANFVRADMPARGGGFYSGINVKDYEIVEPCSCCDGTGYRRLAQMREIGADV